MKRQHIALTAVLVIVLAGLAVLAIHRYDTTKRPLSYDQVVSQRDSAEQTLSSEESLNKAAITKESSLQAQVNTLLNNQTTLCAQIVKAKLPQPAICEE